MPLDYGTIILKPIPIKYVPMIARNLLNGRSVFVSAYESNFQRVMENLVTLCKHKIKSFVRNMKGILKLINTVLFRGGFRGVHGSRVPLFVEK